MSFHVWFRQWIQSFFKLLSFDSKRHKSKTQRQKEYARRLKAKRSSANRYFRKKKRRRRSSHNVQNERLIRAALHFTATTLGVLLLPLGLFDWINKNVKLKKTNTTNLSPNISPRGTAASTPKTETPKTKPMDFSSEDTTSSPANTPAKYPKEKKPDSASKSEEARELEQSTPKSIPKNENDQYIRKRMIIAGSYYCDKTVLDSLAVSSYIDLETEPDNPHDKDAVKLLYNGEKIGYISKQDRLPFAASLKLGRRIYGVITEIFEKNGDLEYEYEVWFDNAKESKGN